MALQKAEWVRSGDRSLDCLFSDCLRRKDVWAMPTLRERTIKRQFGQCERLAHVSHQASFANSATPKVE